MDKKFSELKAGDKLYVWNYHDIYEFSITDVRRKPEYIAGALPNVVNVDDIKIVLSGNYEYTIIYPSEPAMVWGTDGWHEYKIIGTSKEAVKSLLQSLLIADAKILEDKTEKWLKEFDK